MGGLEKRTKQELFRIIELLIEIDRLRTIALGHSIDRTPIHIHEKILEAEKELKEM